MTLRLDARFLWDFWTIEPAGLNWLDALSAPRDPDPKTRRHVGSEPASISR